MLLSVVVSPQRLLIIENEHKKYKNTISFGVIYHQEINHDDMITVQKQWEIHDSTLYFSQYNILVALYVHCLRYGQQYSLFTIKSFKSFII